MKPDELFYILLKNHPLIISRMINKGLILKKDNGFIVNKEEAPKKEKSIPVYNSNKKVNKNVYVVKFQSWEFDEKPFIQIKTRKPTIFQDCPGKVYKNEFRDSLIYYSDPINLNYLIENYEQDILAIQLPKGLRVSGKYVQNYLNILERQITRILNYIEKGGHPSNLEYENFMYNFWQYNWWPGMQWLEKIKSIGIFAYEPLYREIEWNFEYIEKNKNSILWLNLIEKSNIIWEEKYLKQYDKYIPYDRIEDSRPYDKIFGYAKFGKISTSFIDTHKDRLNWNVFCRTANFQLSPSDFLYFYKYLYTNKKYSIIDNLTENPNFKFTKYHLKELLDFKKDSIQYCIYNRYLYELLTQLPNYKHYIKSFNWDKEFEFIVLDGGKQPHDTYSSLFTIDNIKQNKEEWEKVVDTVHSHMKRTPDTNYHWYDELNKWDFFIKNKSIKLNYDLCKYLSTIIAVPLKFENNI